MRESAAKIAKPVKTVVCPKCGSDNVTITVDVHRKKTTHGLLGAIFFWTILALLLFAF